MSITTKAFERYQKQLKERQSENRDIGSKSTEPYYSDIHDRYKAVLAKKYAEKGDASFIQSLVDTYRKKVATYYGDYNERYNIPEGSYVYRGDTEDYLNNVTTGRDDLNREATSIKRELEFYKPYISDEYYNAVIGALDGSIKADDGSVITFDTVVDNATRDHEFYSQFEDEEVYKGFYFNDKYDKLYGEMDVEGYSKAFANVEERYNAAKESYQGVGPSYIPEELEWEYNYLKNKKQTAEYLAYDAAEGLQEIDRLGQIIGEYEAIVVPNTAGMGRDREKIEAAIGNYYNSLDALERKYGMTYEEVKTRLYEAQKYHKTATDYIKSVEYESYRQNEDFDEHSEYDPSLTGGVDIDWLKSAIKGMPETKYNGDLLYDIINGSQAADTYDLLKYLSPDNTLGDLATDLIRGDFNASDISDYVTGDSVGGLLGKLALKGGDSYAGLAQHMEEEEKQLFNYIYHTQGKEAAHEYYSLLSDRELTARKLNSLAGDFENVPTALKVAYSLPAGIDQFASGVEGIFKDEYDPSFTSMAGQKIREDLADEANISWYNAKTGSWENGIAIPFYNLKTGSWDSLVSEASAAQMLYDIGNTSANMLPSILVSAAVEAALPTVGEGGVVFAGLTGAQIAARIAAGAGALTTGASAWGNAKQEMLGMGYSVDQANAYGLMVGASEAGLSYLLSGIPGLRGGDGVFSALGQKVIGKVDNALAKAAIALGGNMLDEGLEEGLQTVLEGWFKEIATGVDFEDPSAEEILYSSLLGALTAAGFGGGKLAIDSSVNAYKTSKAGKGFINSHGQSGVGALAAQGLGLNQNTAAYKQAGKIQAKLDSGKSASNYSVGKLLSSMSESQTGTAIQTRLSAHIKNKSEVRKLSNTITDILYGREVSDKAISAVAANKYALNALNDVLGSKLKSGATVSDVKAAVKSYQAATTSKSGADASTNAKQGSEVKISGRGGATFSVQENADGGFDVIAEAGGNSGSIANYETQKQAQAAAYGYTLGMGAEGVSGLVNLSANLPDGVDLGEAAQAFNAIYSQGKNGKAFSAVKFGELLSPEQRQYAYNLGIMDGALDSARAKKEGGSPPASDVQNSSSLTQRDGNSEVETADRTKPEFLDNDKVEKAQAKVDAAKRTDGKKKKGTVIYDGDRSKLSDMQKKSLDVLDKVAEALGVTFRIYESERVNGKYVYKMPDGVVKSANGWYDPKTGEIWLDINAGLNGEGTLIFTAAHELTHFIKQWSPAKFKIFADFLIEQYGEHGISIDELVQRRIDKAKKKGEDIDLDTAYEEVIADSCETFLRDSDAIEKIAELNQKDASLAQKIKQFLRDMLKRLRELMNGMDPDSLEGKVVAEMTGSLEQLHKLWTDALADAGEAYSGADSVVNSEGGVKEQARNAQNTNAPSNRTFSYNELVSKGDLYGVVVDKNQQLQMNGSIIDANWLVNEVKKGCQIKNTKGRPAYYAEAPDIGRNVEIIRDGITHGFNRPNDKRAGKSTPNAIINAKASLNIVELLRHSIEVNRSQRGANKDVPYTHVLMGVMEIENAAGQAEYYAVRSMVQERTNLNPLLVEVNIVGKLSSVNAKKIGSPATQAGKKTTTLAGGITYFTYSIADFLQDVKGVFDDTFSNDVYAHFNMQRNANDFSANLMFSDRDYDAPINREILADLLESEDMSPSEKGFLTKYKNKLSTIEAAEAEIAKMEAELKELKKKGKKDSSRAITLEGKIEILKKEISRDERLILNLEVTKPIKELLKREIDSAYKKAAAEGNNKLAEYKEKVKAHEARIKQEHREMRERASDRRHSSEIRGKIKAFKEKLQRTLRHPTDRKYIPGALAQAMIDVCELIDTDTELYKADGSINKAQERRERTRESLRLLRDEYDKIAEDADPLYAGEYDEYIAAYLDTLEGVVGGKSLDEMSRSELEDMYEILQSIDGTLREARKLIGWKEAVDVYESGDVIISEQKKIAGKRKNGKRNLIKKANDGLANQSLSPVRRVLEICGYDRNSPLYKLFKAFEKGVREARFFEMGAKKSFEKLTTGKNTKTYENAVYTADGGNKYTDSKGRKFGISKMQKMQAILSFEREVANKKTHHIEEGGFLFADLDALGKGNLKDAVNAEISHRVRGSEAVKLIEQFKQELEGDSWAQDYMAASRIFFNETAKNAINDAYMKLKHRILATDLAYIPFETDPKSITREISAKYDAQPTISAFGMLQETQKGASNALVMTGLNNILERHIQQVSIIHGLAVPIRNFNKVWNVKSADSDVTVKEQVESTAGAGATKLIEQTVMDLQGERSQKLSGWYKKTKSNYIGAQFWWNFSVIGKQISSLFSATTMLRWRDPMRMLANLVVTASRRKKIAAEVDKYTATAWIRRQGLSDAELQILSSEKRKNWLSKLLQSGSKGMIYMDSTVALSLWKYAKQDVAKKTGLRGEELMRATAEFYDELIENTQSMSDVLHRPEVQRSGGVGTELFGTFKTDLYQNAGNLRMAVGEFAHNRTKENAAKVAKTVGSIMTSALWASMVTSIIAALRYKVDRYRDEEDELTAESWLKVQGEDLIIDLAGYVLPAFGSEIAEVGFNLRDGYQFGDAIFSAIPYDAFNDLYAEISKTISKEDPGIDDYLNIVAACGNVLGLPTNSMYRSVKAAENHIKDFINGEPFSFNEGYYSSKKISKTDKLYRAMINDDEDRIVEMKAKFDDESEVRSAIKKAIREKDPRVQEAVEAVLGLSRDFKTYRLLKDDIVDEGHFDIKTVNDAFADEKEYVLRKLKEAREEKKKGDLEDYEEIIDALIERGYSEEFIEKKLKYIH